MLIVMLSFFFINITCLAQSHSDKNINEIGVGLQYFPINKELIFYNLSYKRTHHKNAFRSGVGFFPFNAELWKKHFCFYANLGYERRFTNKNSSILLGVDASFLTVHNETSSIHMLEPNTFYGYGIGPVIGYMYRFSDRISFQSELSIYYAYSKRLFFDPLISYSKKQGFFYSFSKFFSLNFYYHL